jgi:hypothetical protein
VGRATVERIRKRFVEGNLRGHSMKTIAPDQRRSWMTKKKPG